MIKKIKNIELITLALYQAGGASKFVDTETIAVISDKLDDQRFKWKKKEYKNFIDKVLVFDTLRAAKARKIGSFLKGNDDQGWILTPAGLEFCKKSKDIFKETVVRKKRISKVEKNFLNREQDRIIQTKAFNKFFNNKKEEITDEDIKDLFRVDDYSSKLDVQKRITNMLDNFKESETVYQLINTYKERAINNAR